MQTFFVPQPRKAVNSRQAAMLAAASAYLKSPRARDEGEQDGHVGSINSSWENQIMNRLASFAFAFGTLGCLFLITPVYAIGQDLSEAQRRERCENNRRYIADYDRQLEPIEAKLKSTMSDEELARAQANFNFARYILRWGDDENAAVKEEQVARLEELSRLYGLDQQKYCPRGFKVYHGNCVVRLAEVIRLRIEAAKQANPQRDELNKQRTQLQKQRAIHQSRLDELGCGPGSEPQKSGCQGFAGAWKTTFGTMTFERQGNQITSSYDFDGGNIRGILSGDGRTLTGTYTETEAKGTFRFSLAADGKSFSGNWTRTSGTREPPNGEWSGECTSP